MSIIRDLPFTLQSIKEQPLVTCSCVVGSVWSSGYISSGTTGDFVAATSAGAFATFYGRVIDRLGPEIGNQRFAGIIPQTHIKTTVGSTEANRQIKLNADIQHGDSSGGGDMAYFSTPTRAADKVLFSTARTCDQRSWELSGNSTGAIAGAASNPAVYDLRPMKRFVRGVHFVNKNNVTTESSGDEMARVTGTLTFVGAEYVPYPAGQLQPFATSTTT